MSSDAEDRSRPRPSVARSGAAGALDALETVRGHPEWFFRDGTFNADEALLMLMKEAVQSGAGSVAIGRQGSWLTVEADQDWLKGDVAAFFRPLSYPEGGRNSTRVEVALTAFCPAVVTATSAGLYEVSSSPDSAHLGAELDIPDHLSGRLIAFVPPADAHSTQPTSASTPPKPTRPLRLIQGGGEDEITSAVGSFVLKRASLYG